MTSQGPFPTSKEKVTSVGAGNTYMDIVHVNSQGRTFVSSGADTGKHNMLTMKEENDTAAEKCDTELGMEGKINVSPREKKTEQS